MNHLSTSFMRIIIITSLFIIQLAHANLLISPTRVTFDDRQRSEKIILMNSSEETRTYRISWQEKKSLSTGGTSALKEEELQSFPTASNMLRYSPKQVTLKAGERQIIKLALRRPKDLKDGEYRSYLWLKALPPKREKNKKGGFSMQLNTLLSYSLPVVVRQGPMIPPEINIEQVQLSYSPRKVSNYIEKSKNDVSIQVTISRSGLYSTAGNLIAYWKGVDDKEEQIIAQVHKLPIYPELDQINFKLKWPNTSITAGQLRISYQDSNTLPGTVLSEKILDVTASMFKKSIQ